MRRFGTLALLSVVLWSVAVAGTGCKPKSAKVEATAGASASAEKSLYERLGGGAAIAAVVKDFVNTIASDTRINQFFQDADLPKLETNLTALIDQASGGPEKYTGRDMKTVHHGLGIADADFNALVDDLTKSLEKFKVPQAEQGELLALLAGMKGDIVEK